MGLLRAPVPPLHQGAMLPRKRSASGSIVASELPIGIDSSANTSSFAVYSLTGLPSGLPSAYRREKIDENLTYDVERLQSERGWSFD